MGFFSDINKHTSGGNRNYFHPGQYLAKITGIKWKPEGFKGKSYIAEFEVVEVLLQRAVEKRINTNGKEVIFEASRKVGDSVSQVFKLDGPNMQMALGNLADFMRAVIATDMALGGEPLPSKLSEINIPDGAIEETYSDEQPLVGMVLEVDAQGTITVAKQEAFTIVNYKVPRTLLDQAAA